MSTEYTITGYHYDELSDEAKKRAVLDTRDALAEMFDADSLNVWIEEEARTLLGMPIEVSTPFPFDLRWRLDYSQGDGVALYGVALREQVPNIPMPPNAMRVDLTQRSLGDYHHHNSFDVEVMDEHYEVIDAPETEAAFREVCEALARFGYERIDYETSEEAALDWLGEAGDVFHADGTMIPWRIMRERTEA
jgi:hypothetical protein